MGQHKQDPLKKRVRTWQRVGIMPIEAKPDIMNGKNMAQLGVAGQRSDGKWFTVPIILDVDKLKTTDGFTGVQNFHALVAQCYTRLETFRDCNCSVIGDEVCPAHQPPTPN